MRSPSPLPRLPHLLHPRGPRSGRRWGRPILTPRRCRPAPTSPRRPLLTPRWQWTSPPRPPCTPPPTVAYARRPRSTSTPVTSSRRSARLEASRPGDSPAPSVAERAELRAAVRNLESGADPAPPGSSRCSFSALEAAPLGHLAKVANDSAIVFRGEVGPPLDQIEAIRAREILDGKLAESRARLLRPPAPTPLVADGIIHGRTRSRTAALRAQSASRVLGSSSPPMGV